jgi:hypothetical protein
VDTRRNRLRWGRGAAAGVRRSRDLPAIRI